ncbi:MAG: M13-type metalloendopeptidase [Christensenellaceae bacterium]
MNFKIFKRTTAMLTALAMVIGLNIVAFAEKPIDTGYATREYVVSEFVQSVGRNNITNSDYILSTFTDSNDIKEEYKEDVSKAVSKGLVRGYEDKTLRPKENVLRVEALTMLSRCMDETEEVAEAIEFTDVPDWAKDDMSRLSKAGIILGYGDGRLGAEDYITQEQVQILTDRTDEIFNTVEPGESFYGYVNNKSFRNAKLSSTNTVDAKHGAIISTADAWSAMGDIAQKVSEQETVALEKLMNGELEFEKGSAEQRVHDMLLCIDESKKPTEADKTIVNNIRNKIINANTVEELFIISEEIYKETGVNVLFDISPEVDPETNIPAPSISLANVGSGAMINYNSSVKENISSYYQGVIKDYAISCGFEASDDDAKKAVEAQEIAGKDVNYMNNYIMGQTLKQMFDRKYDKEAQKKDLDALLKEHPEVDPETHEDKESPQKVYTVEEADKAVQSLNPSKILNNVGFKNYDKIIFPFDESIKDMPKVFVNSNLDALKINSLVKLGVTLGCALNDKEQEILVQLEMMPLAIALNIKDDAVEEKKEEIIDLGNKQEETKEPILSPVNLANISKIMPYDIGMIYCNQYYDDAISDDVGNMIDKIWNAYLERFGNSDWMSAETKENATKKIHNMIAVIGYPDNYNFATITSPSEGGTYLSNIISINKNDLETNIRFCSEKQFIRENMFMSPDTVNACYVPQFNTMNILAGILNAPCYDKNATEAQNLGAIGAIIGHEIGHAFDSNGSKYDEVGRLRNWWTDEDAAKFDEKKKYFVEYYKQFEIIDGVVQNSEVTITENMADFAGLQAIMDAVGDDKEAQKEALEAWAKIWARLGTEKYVTHASLLNDVHAANNVRVDAVIASLDCFYEIYDVKEGDPMYVAPEKRLKLW